MIYFSSDWHLDHANIIKYDKRPFKSVEEMNHTIIGNAVGRLRKGDDFYYLGDFAMTRSSNSMEGHMKALAMTEANLFFIKGNHDKSDTIKLYQRYGTYLGEQKKIKVYYNGEIQEIILNHYALRVWDKCHHGSWHLYGHSHGTLPDLKDSKSFDCGINCHKYDILDLTEVGEIMSKKTFKAVDHHGKTGRA